MHAFLEQSKMIDENVQVEISTHDLTKVFAKAICFQKATH